MKTYIYDCGSPQIQPDKPSFSVPAGACDTHFHIFGPYRQFPLQESRLFTPPQATFQDCARMHETLGIERGVIVHSGAHGLDLRPTINALERAGGRWRAVAVVDPMISLRDLRALNDLGFRGARLNFADGTSTLQDMRNLAPKFKEIDWHIELLIGLDMLVQLEVELSELPVECVIDHMGYTHTDQGIDHAGFQALLRLVSDEKCWVKLSGADRVGRASNSYEEARSFMQALVHAKSQRLLWGSDWPHVRMAKIENDGVLLNLFGAWIQDPTIRKQILVDNPAELYGFKD